MCVCVPIQSSSHLKSSSYHSFTKMRSNIYISHMFRMCVCKVPLFILFLYILSSLLNVSLILMAFLREMIKDLDADVKKGGKILFLPELQLMRVLSLVIGTHTRDTKHPKIHLRDRLDFFWLDIPKSTSLSKACQKS